MTGVETAGGDVEDGAGEDRDDQGAEDGRDGGVTAVFDETDDVAAGEEGDGGDGESNPDNGAKGGAEGLLKLSFLPFPDFLGELGEEGGGDGDADEVNWHGGEVVGLLVGTKSAGAHAGGKVGGDDGVEVVHTLVKRTGGQEFEDGTEALIAPADFEFVIKAEAEETDETN